MAREPRARLWPRAQRAGGHHRGVRVRCPIAVEGITPTPCVPITLGHEIAGTVTAVGDAARGWVTGERVCVFLVLFDGTGSMAWPDAARSSYGGPWRRCSEYSGSSPAASSL